MSGFRTAVAALVCAAIGCALRPAESPPNPPPDPRVCEGVNDFGFRLLRTLSDGKQRENVIVSPLSVSLALAMTYDGAAGGTRDAIARTIGAPSIPDDEFNRANLDLIHTFKTADPKVELSIANALWLQADFSIESAFRKTVEDSFEASVRSLDFARDPQGAANAINSWVKKQTHEKIPSIIDVPPRLTRFVITDAIYFKGRWSRPFEKSATKPRDFFPPGGPALKAPMMSQSGEYSYFETPEFQAVALPYGDERLAMYVFLPREKDGLPAFLKSLDRPRWTDWIGKFTQAKGTIILPKLEGAWGKKLNDTLKAMGMEDAFDPGRADFSRIHAGSPRLYIDDVEHKTWVKVDEEGTEAAAATSVRGVAVLAVQSRGKPFTMVVDHPYLFAIAERQTRALLFLGLVADPTRRN